jgi:murein DD-endopeptidase MepM/ murein hydrolase activator NlpD
MRLNALFFLCFLVFSTSFTDPITPPQYPKDYFQSPVAGKLRLSGTFGELRPNHFHGGIDITRTQSGHEPIFAAAEGYVARIVVQEGGYGQAIYIVHPNGFSTVYGHLESFVSEIQAVVRQKQYENERFELDVRLEPNQIPVRQGQQIGTMGNRGHSFGQHLHFEVRDSSMNVAYNPLLFGFSVADSEPPRLRSVKAYFFNEKQELVGERLLDVSQKSTGVYQLTGIDTLSVPASHVAFALKTTDSHDGDSGDNGIFSLQMNVNDSTAYYFSTEKCAFDQTRYINAHLDFYEHLHRRANYHRAFLLNGSRLKMYQNVADNRGITPLSINADLGQKFNFQIKDAAGNTSTLEFFARSTEPFNLPKPLIFNYILPFDQESIVKPDGGATFYFPRLAFYENVFAQVNVSNTEGGNFSPTYHFHNFLTPVHYPFDISILPIGLPDELRNKAFISFCQTDDSRTYNVGGTWQTDGSLRTKNLRFGNYALQIDTVKPTIRVENFGETMYRNSRIAFKIRDNFETSGNARALRYRAEVDGKWLMMELDGKYDLLTHRLEENRIAEGEHTFKLVVTDALDNETVFERTFEVSDSDAPKPKKAAPKKRRR